MTDDLHAQPGDRQSSATGPGPAELEVHLEELGRQSWVKALLSTLTGTFGSAPFRFVARPPDGRRADASGHVAQSATFPAMRLQDLDDRTEPNAWSELARQRLDELDRELTQAGWSRTDRTGPHWWSLTYRRPRMPNEIPPGA
jgi:hypothetical protein